MKEVYVAGIGSTSFGEQSTKDAIFLAVEAALKALLDAKKTIEDMDAIYVGNMLAGLLNGQNHLGSHLAEQLGTTVPIYRLEAACASGGLAVNLGWKSVAGGMAQNVLVLGTESMTRGGTNRVNKGLKNAASSDEIAMNIGFAGLYGLMANAYLHEYNVPENMLWWAPALMHRQAILNPKAQYKKVFTPKQIGSSRMISDPLRLLECSPHTDGAAAIVLSQSPSDLQLLGSIVKMGPPGLAERNTITSISTAAEAWQGLKEQHQISASDLDIIELHDCFSIGAVLAVEDLEIAKRGQGGEFFKDLYQGIDRGITVNPSGGLKAGGHPVGATGVKQIVSVVEYMRTHPKMHKGLTHNIGGTGGTAVLHYLTKT